MSMVSVNITKEALIEAIAESNMDVGDLADIVQESLNGGCLSEDIYLAHRILSFVFDFLTEGSYDPLEDQEAYEKVLASLEKMI